MVKTIKKLFLIILAVTFAACSFACKLTDDDTPTNTVKPAETNNGGAVKPAVNDGHGLKVVLSTKNVDLTFYDFSQSYYNSQYYFYYAYGIFTAEQFYNSVLDEVKSFLYIVNAAYDAGIELTSEENEEIRARIDTQLEEVLKNYEEKVPEGTEDVRAEAIKLLENDIAEEGIDYNAFIELAIKNLGMNMIANKYYTRLADEIEISDDDVLAYINDNMSAAQSMSMSDFADALGEFNSGSGGFPVYIPKDCFTVNHIFMAFETDTESGETVVYDTESRSEDEAALEAKFQTVEGFDGFMTLVDEFGEDPGMEAGTGYRESGYVIHPDLDQQYYEGFVYAAMNLHDGSWYPSEDSDYELPELSYFELKDGKRIVKVKTASGVHYITVNQEFTKGSVPYEVGDQYWESWKSNAASLKLEDRFSELLESWKELYPIEIDTATLEAAFLKAE